MSDDIFGFTEESNTKYNFSRIHRLVLETDFPDNGMLVKVSGLDEDYNTIEEFLFIRRLSLVEHAIEWLSHVFMRPMRVTRITDKKKKKLFAKLSKLC